VTVEEAVTLLVVAVKDALVAPAGTVTLAGTVTTAVLLLESETVAPPVGAGALRVTSPDEGDPPTTLLGVRLKEVRLGPAAGCGVTVSEAVCVRPPLDAEIVTAVELAEAIVATWNAALVAPAAMVTLDGTVATEVLLLARETTVPPLGAGPLRATCPVEGLPPFTLVGLSVSEARAGPGAGCGATVREAVCVRPELDAEIVTIIELAEAIVATWNVALVAPAMIVTLDGTVAAEVLLLDRETTVPPLGAAPLRVTCPVEGLPPLTLVGLSVSEARVAELCGGGVDGGAPV
jgi:phosphohistidine swiveling domain-containing protein